ncbi:MAG: hypothetical protein MZU97_24940 [Bacillus subtilis]|nr:hypothetical protein [Bacillus subtilis]
MLTNPAEHDQTDEHGHDAVCNANDAAEQRIFRSAFFTAEKEHSDDSENQFPNNKTNREIKNGIENLQDENPESGDKGKQFRRQGRQVERIAAIRLQSDHDELLNRGNACKRGIEIRQNYRRENPVAFRRVDWQRDPIETKNNT